MSTAAKFAVAVIVLRHNAEVEGGWECILVARKDDHSRWSLPGGKVDPGETSVLAAAREFAEETGVVVGYTAEITPSLRFIPQETVLDSGGYFTTFYLLDTTGLELPDEFDVEDHEAPVRWGPVYELLEGPYGQENADRLRKIGIFP
jgi:8-oxo-dGTP pyrophosphatase MutT (NUDIX family)